MKWYLLPCALTLLLTSRANAESLNEAVLANAPKILAYLQTHDIKNVGVLKFLYAEGLSKSTDIGTINQTLADRLEMGLILSGDIEGHIGVIRNASAKAATLPGADFRSEEGRKALFQAKYPLAWGNAEVSADAFLTGVVRIQPDRSLNVGVFLVRPNEPFNLHLISFVASPNLASLMETGQSFRTRGWFEGGSFPSSKAKLEQRRSLVTNEATETAVRVRQHVRQHHPANPKNNPTVVVTILYDGVRQKLEYLDGHAQIPEPKADQVVTFEIERKDRTIAGPLGVVLKINGENSIEQQRFRAPECRKWLLNPGDKYVVRKFLLPKGQKSIPFRVLSPKTSQDQAFRYGTDVGTISWTVFRTFRVDKQGDLPEPRTYEASEAEALDRGLYPKKQAASLALLREALSAPDKGDRSRGLVADNPSKPSDTPTTLPFATDPAPILHSSVRCYKKGS